MNWLFLTFFAIISRAAYSIVIKVLNKDVRISPITQLYLLGLTAGIISLLISPFLGGISLTNIYSHFIPLILLTVSQVFGNILFFIGLKKLDAGTSQIAFSSILIWGALLSVIFLGSSFSILQIIGIILMLVAILIIQYKKNRIELNSSFLYVILSAALFAIFQVVSADISNVYTTGTYLFISYFGPVIIVSFLYFKTLKKDLSKLQSQFTNIFVFTFFSAITSILYFIFSYLAYKVAPDKGIVVILLTLQVILSVIFGVIFLHEKENKMRKLLAGILAFLSGILIKS